MRELNRPVQLFRASLALTLLSAATVAACGASTTGSGDAGGKQDSDYLKPTISIPLDPGCVNERLVDTKPYVDQVQPYCQVILRAPCNTPGAGACHADGTTENALPECIEPATGVAIPPSSRQTPDTPDNGRPCWYFWSDRDACPDTFRWNRFSVLQKTGVVSVEGSLLELTCLVCADLVCPAIDLQN